jgi:hypothetical protein
MTFKLIAEGEGGLTGVGVGKAFQEEHSTCKGLRKEGIRGDIEDRCKEGHDG